jgi:hypothetical protein
MPSADARKISINCARNVGSSNLCMKKRSEPTLKNPWQPSELGFPALDQRSIDSPPREPACDASSTPLTRYQFSIDSSLLIKCSFKPHHVLRVSVHNKLRPDITPQSP